MISLRRLLSPDVRPGLDAGLLALRAFAGTALALAHGFGKVSDLNKFTASVANKGFFAPEVLAPAAALSEFAGGLLVAIGLLTRPAATMMLVTMLVAAFGVHGDDPFKKKEMALLYASVALALVISGPGRYSVDAKLFGARANGE